MGNGEKQEGEGIPSVGPQKRGEMCKSQHFLGNLRPTLVEEIRSKNTRGGKNLGGSSPLLRAMRGARRGRGRKKLSRQRSPDKGREKKRGGIGREGGEQISFGALCSLVRKLRYRKELPGGMAMMGARKAA